MFKAAKRYKHVIHDDLDAPKDSQCIVQILKPRGSCLYEVISPTGEQYLVSMPNRYRKMIWVKRGDYVLTDPIEEGDKVKGEIIKRLTEVICYVLYLFIVSYIIHSFLFLFL